MIRWHSTWNALSLGYVCYICYRESPVCLIASQLTVLGMKHHEENIALQAVEFWSTVCEEEIELAIEAAEVGVSISIVKCRTDTC